MSACVRLRTGTRRMCNAPLTIITTKAAGSAAAAISTSGSIVSRSPGSVGFGAGKSSSAPKISAKIPPAIRMPWLVTQISETNSSRAKTRSATPAAFAASVPSAKSAITIAMTPITPGKIRLGLESSKISPKVPRVKSRSAICGSTTTCRKVSIRFGSFVSTRAPASNSVIRRPATSTLFPSALCSTSATSLATKSTTFSRAASSSRTDALFRTASSAHRALRPRANAIFCATATVSFSTFCRRSPLMSLPEESTGCAAPMFVAGAMAATCPAIVMNIPADTARAPAGETYVMTGTRELSKRPVIRNVECARPPGVSIWKATAAAPCPSARATMRSTYCAVTGLMTPSIFPNSTVRSSAGAGCPRATPAPMTASQTTFLPPLNERLARCTIAEELLYVERPGSPAAEGRRVNPAVRLRRNGVGVL